MLRCPVGYVAREGALPPVTGYQFREVYAARLPFCQALTISNPIGQALCRVKEKASSMRSAEQIFFSFSANFVMFLQFFQTL